MSQKLKSKTSFTQTKLFFTEMWNIKAYISYMYVLAWNEGRANVEDQEQQKRVTLLISTGKIPHLHNFWCPLQKWSMIFQSAIDLNIACFNFQVINSAHLYSPVFSCFHNNLHWQAMENVAGVRFIVFVIFPWLNLKNENSSSK